MWKFISRGFRETVERGLNFSRNNNVRVSNEAQRTKFCHDCTKRASFLHLYNSRQKCDESNYNKESTNEKENKCYGSQDAFDSWLGAVSCSSAIALGWILCHPFHWKKWFADTHKEKNGLSLVDCLAKVAFAQPVLPPSQLNVSSANHEDEDSGPEFGPQTPEEALDEAANNFLKVHNNIFGEIENKKAITYLKGPKKDERKALQLFFSASKKGHIPAAYNLGQCYELGIGATQDFHEAAKWYQKAADGNHPNATYNLAVFYAHGWGGLEADTKKTKKLLKKAAALGQPDAVAALGLSPTKSSHPPIPDDSSQPQLVLQLYKMASDLGHSEAKTKYKILRAYDTVGLLAEYLCRGSKPYSDCYSGLRFPTVF